MEEERSGSVGNGSAGLAKLLNQLNLPTLGLILFMTGGNWWETKAGNDFNAKEIERAVDEIHQLYPRLNEAIERQKQLQLAINDIKDQVRTK